MIALIQNPGWKGAPLRFPLRWAAALCLVAFLANLDAVSKISMLLPYLLIALLTCISAGAIVRCLAHGVKLGQSIGSIVLMVIASFLIWAMPTLYDGMTFLMWAPFHAADLVRASGKDQTIAHWDGWGFAGMDNDSYLVVDTGDRLSTDAGAREWERRTAGTCEVLAARRMVPRIYIAITDGCTP